MNIFLLNFLNGWKTHPEAGFTYENKDSRAQMEWLIHGLCVFKPRRFVVERNFNKKKKNETDAKTFQQEPHAARPQPHDGRVAPHDGRVTHAAKRHVRDVETEIKGERPVAGDGWCVRVGAVSVGELSSHLCLCFHTALRWTCLFHWVTSRAWAYEDTKKIDQSDTTRNRAGDSAEVGTLVHV